MISETTFVGCKDLPPEMLGRFDQPWVFIGEVKGNRYFQRAVCKKCARKLNTFSALDVLACNITYQTVELRGYLFITDDMLEVIVYFGVCGQCDTVHWARSGPPFRRVRACVPA